MAPSSKQKEPKTEFGRRLKSLMLEKGWNQSDLARHADMGRDNVSGYINGKYLPNAKHLHRLAHALNVSGQTLLPSEEEMPVAPREEEYLEMRQIPGRSGRVSLRINKVVPMPLAIKVIEMIEQNDQNRS